MIRLNLLPDVQHQTQDARKTEHIIVRAAQVVTGIAGGTVLLLALWVYGIQALQGKIVTDSIDSRYQKLRAVKDIDTYATIQQQLAALPELRKDKNLTSRLYDYLPTLNSGATLRKVTLDSTQHTLRFEGEVPDYRRLVIFRDTLRNASLQYMSPQAKPQKSPLFTSVMIDKSSVKPRDTLTYVSFVITAHYQKAAFRSEAVRPSILITKKETTPSVLAAPLVTGGGVQP